MKIGAALFLFLISLCPAFGQGPATLQNEPNPIRLSYQELLDRMSESRDSVFTLENAIVEFNPESDQRFIPPDSAAAAGLDSIVVKAKIELDNIDFRGSGGAAFVKVKFEDEVSIRDAKVEFGLGFAFSTLKSDLNITVSEDSRDFWIALADSEFNAYTSVRLTHGYIVSLRSRFDPVNKRKLEYYLFNTDHDESQVLFQGNRFVRRDSTGFVLVTGHLYTLRLWRNTFGPDLKFMELSIEDITMIENTFEGLIDMTNVDFGSQKSELYYQQLGGKIGVYSNEDQAATVWQPETYESFADTVAAERFFNIYRRLTDHFKTRGNIRDYNSMYVEMKDFETLQLQYYYEKEKGVDALFSWKMNQLLGLISDYGTRPTKSIIYSFYVILIFALVYVFFPNSWDTAGRKRLVDRYTFFMKYLRKDAGIHEVYLENRQAHILQYHEFRNLIEESGRKVPGFFTATARPIYRWAVSGTNLSAKLLSKFDIIQGRWEDVPKSTRFGKSILVTGFFILAILYDLMVKALNALMLSINAFTTLGFGEIPIRGIPRYLAILQGFIGWFMLTIFSVSLISQLLN